MTTTLPAYNPPQSGGVGSLPSTRDYMNDVKAATDSLSARDDVLMAGLNAQEGAVATEAAARAAADVVLAAADDALGDRISELLLARPGDAPDNFQVRSGTVYSDIPSGWVTTNVRGACVRAVGTVEIVSAMFAVERRRIYRALLAGVRSANTPDPANNGVETGIRWYGYAGAPLSGDDAETIIHQYTDLRDESGPWESTLLISHLAGDYQAPPSSACYGRLFVRRFGSEGADDFEVMEWRDVLAITDQETADVEARVAAIEGLKRSGSWVRAGRSRSTRSSSRISMPPRRRRFPRSSSRM